MGRTARYVVNREKGKRLGHIETRRRCKKEAGRRDDAVTQVSLPQRIRAQNYAAQANLVVRNITWLASSFRTANCIVPLMHIKIS